MVRQVHNDTVGDAAQLLQAQWKRLGQGTVDAQLKLSDTPTMDSIRASRSFTYGVFGFSADMVEPGIWLNTTYRTGGSLNFAGLSDPTLDAVQSKVLGYMAEGVLNGHQYQSVWLDA